MRELFCATRAKRCDSHMITRAATRLKRSAFWTLEGLSWTTALMVRCRFFIFVAVFLLLLSCMLTLHGVSSYLGVLAVTRALGDSSMKEFVIGAPYTTRTEVGPDNPYLILACDGVSLFHFCDPYVQRSARHFLYIYIFLANNMFSSNMSI